MSQTDRKTVAQKHTEKRKTALAYKSGIGIVCLYIFNLDIFINKCDICRSDIILQPSANNDTSVAYMLSILLPHGGRKELPSQQQKW